LGSKHLLSNGSLLRQSILYVLIGNPFNFYFFVQQMPLLIPNLNDNGLLDGNGKHGEGLCGGFVPAL
jgi:hypothetical protein